MRSRHDRKGSLYLTVLGTGMIVAVLALAALTICRVQRRITDETADQAEARCYAEAGVQIGLLKIKSTASWRTTFTNGTWESNRPVGVGTYSLEGIDPNDGNLANSTVEPLQLTATGASGSARHKTRVLLVYDAVPLAALNMCLHAAGAVNVISGKSVRVTGAPLSTNGLLQVDSGAYVYGDAQSASFSGSGTVIGTRTTPAPAKPLPASSVFANYQALATTVPYLSTYDKKVLTPTKNTFGGSTNAGGVYYIDGTGADVIIQGCRVNGTLLVKCNKLVLDDAVFFHSYNTDYPVLIVDGAVEMMYKTASYGLSELSWITNFNPTGAPYNGSTDSDTLDTYPNEVQGLVHVKGNLTMKQTACVRGVVLCEGAVTCEETNEIIHTPSLYQNPPMGYRTERMIPAPDGWQQIVN